MWFPLALLSAVLYACMWLFARGSRGMPTAFVTAAASMWAPPMLVWTLFNVDYPWGDPLWQRYLVLPFFLIPITLLGLTLAGQRTEVSIIKPLSALSTVAALCASVLLFGAEFRLAHTIGIAVITVGLLLLYHGRWESWRTPWPWIAFVGVLVLGANAAVAREVLVIFREPLALITLAATGSFCVNGALAIRERRVIKIASRDVVFLFAFAATNLAQDLLTFTALTMGPAPHVIAVKRTSILFAAFMSYFIFRDRDQPLWRLMAASGVVVIGVACLSLG
jgi:uncharacterized membrane protein